MTVISKKEKKKKEKKKEVIDSKQKGNKETVCYQYIELVYVT